MAGDGFGVHPHLQHRLAGDLLARDFGGCRYAGQHLLYLPGQAAQLVEVVAQDLDGHLAAHPGDHLVHAHLDGLAEGGGHARHHGKDLAHGLDKLRLGARLLPLVAGFEGDEEVGQLDAHGIGGDLGGAQAGPDMGDLVGKAGQQLPFQPIVEGHGLLH